MKYQEYKELSDAMEQAAHKFYQLRYQMSNGGNLSMRVPGHDWMLVKATDVAFDEARVFLLDAQVYRPLAEKITLQKQQ